MNAVCNWGIQSLLPKDYTKDQVLGNIRMLVRLGFAPRIIEVVNGKVLEFTLVDGQVEIEELEEHRDYFKNGDLIRSIWEHEGEDKVDEKHWPELSPDSATVFLPSETDFFEQINNVSGPPVYIESCGNVIRRIDQILLETPPGLDDAYREKLDYYRRIFYTALKFCFIVTVSGVKQ